MVSIRRGNINQSTETRIESDLTSRNTETKIGARIKREIIRANTKIGTRTSTDIAPVPLRTRRSKMAVIVRIKRGTKRVPLVRTRSTRVAVRPARIRTRAETKNIITNQVRAPKTRTGKMRRMMYKILQLITFILYIYICFYSFLLDITAVLRIRTARARIKIRTRTRRARIKTGIDTAAVL